MSSPFRYTPRESHKSIQLARAAAIEAYANLEQQLCLQFMDLMECDYSKASIVFYKITSTHFRNRILQTLLNQEYGDTYKKFWGSLIKLIRQIDQERNKVVHWHLVGQEPIEDGEMAEEDELVLAPHAGSDEKALTVEALWEFVEKTEYVRCQAIMFYIFHLTRPSPEARQADKTYEAFLRPCSYPPQANNLGFHIGPIPETPPQSPEK